MSKILLYTDNGCDLNLDVLKQYNVKQFYLATIINGETYLGRLNLSPADFYMQLQQPGLMPTTSQVNISTMVAEFESALQDEEAEIIYVAFSGELSGTYQSGCIARDSVDPSRITVIDSGSASVGQGLAVLRAAKLIAAGADKDAIIKAMNFHVAHIEHVFMVGNFEMLKRGGRVNAAVAGIGDLLNIKLILQLVGGKIVPLEKVHGLKKAKKRFLEIMEQRSDHIKEQVVGISYAQDLDGAMEVRDLIAQKFGVNKFVISEIGPLIGAHVGPGTLAVFFYNN